MPLKGYFKGLLVLFIILGCSEQEMDEASELVFETQHHAIRNGTREPQVLTLNDAQKLAIGWLHPRGAAARPFCTGTLVSPRVVATASHCLQGRRPGQIGFGVGLLPREATHTFNVAQAIPHPQLDAALLILDEDATAAGSEIQPIPFGREAPDRSLVGTEIEAAGYGETYDASREGRYFAVVQLSAIQSTVVIVDGRGRQGICFGDSGGPVMVTDEDGRTVVLGVESWGDPSCLGVDHLTRLDVIADWIDENVAQYLEVEQVSPECRAAGPDGRCDGDTLEWCEDGEVMIRDCAEEGLACNRSEDGPGYDCLEPDPCEVLGSRGACDGDTVQRCRFGELQLTDCSEEGKVCRADAGGAFCAPPSDSEAPVAQQEAVGEQSGPEESGMPGGTDDAVDDEAEPLGRTMDESEPRDSVGGSMSLGAPESERRKGGGCQVNATQADTPYLLFAPWLLLFGLRTRRRASILFR